MFYEKSDKKLHEIVQEKEHNRIIKRVKEALPDDNPVWIMYSSENSDPYFGKFITKKTTAPAVSLVSKENIVLLVHGLDADNIKNFGNSTIIYNKSSEISTEIKTFLRHLGFPSNIYLNYSDVMDTATDVLGHGTYQFLYNLIKEFYEKNGKNVYFHSADFIICTLMDKKSEEDIKYMKLSANRGLQIIEDVFKKIKPGVTEKEIFNIFHEKFNKKPDYFKSYGIVKEEFAWDKAGCPIVLVGSNLAKGGHSLPSERTLNPGDTIYFDFGVKLCLDDGRKYSSDLQRMGYVLKDGETHAPDNVQRVFDTLVEAISLGIENCEPQKRGYEIDSIVRNYIINKGYPNYNHSTGHPVGEMAHSPGTSIAPESSKRSHLFLQENGVYTIEPRIQMENGGSIEEMVVVGKSGGQTLCKQQKSLYLI